MVAVRIEYTTTNGVKVFYRLFLQRGNKRLCAVRFIIINGYESEILRNNNIENFAVSSPYLYCILEIEIRRWATRKAGVRVGKVAKDEPQKSKR